MRIAHRSLFVLILTILLALTTVNAQDSTPVEPPTAAPIPTDVPTSIPTDIPTAIPTETYTPEPSLTPLPPPTNTPVPTASDTASPEASLTPSETSTDAASPTLTASPSLTATASATVSLTPSMTASAQMQNQVGVIMPLANPIACTPSASIQQANVSSTGDRGDVSGNMNSLSSDGRYLYFPSKSANLVVNDGNNAVDYFEFDRTNCNTRRITVGPNGEEGDADSDVGNISGNGQYFAFASKASTFVAGDSNAKYDIFVKNLSTNTITRIPADPTDAISGAYYIGDVTISDDGRYVAFDVLVPAQTYTGFTGTPILYDTQNSTRTVIAAEGRSLYISGDGNYIAFASSVANLVGGDTNNVDDVFLYQRTSGTFDRVSIATNGAQTLTTQNYYNLAISSDGRFVSFDTADALVADDTNGTLGTDIYVRDRLTNQTSRVSVNNDGSQFASGVGLNRMSADGRYVTFMTSSTAIWVRDLVSSQTYQITNPYSSNGGLDISADGSYIAFSTQTGTAPNITRDVYVAKRLDFALATPTPTPTPTYTATLVPCILLSDLSVVSINSGGILGNNTSGETYIALSDTGRYVVYLSSASNLVANDSNNKSDVFMFDRQTCQTTRLSTALNGDQTNNATSAFAISSNAQIIAMHTFATNLVSGITTGGIYVRNLTANTLSYIPNTSQTIAFVSISGDGRYLTYTESPSTDTRVVVIYDLATNQRLPIATMTAPAINSIWSKISSDGNNVVYRTETGTLYIFNRITQQTISPSLGLDPIFDFDISANGRYILFQSDATSLVPNDTNGKGDLFVLDTQNNQITRVSVASDGSEGNNTSAFASISPDGRYITFVSTATNLVPGDNNNQSDVFVRDRTTNQTFVISARTNGILGNASSGGYTIPISANNQYIAFFSYANNLVDGDTGFAGDVFVANLPAYQASGNATATAIAPATQTAGVPATQTAAAATATAGPFATQTSAAATATYIAANGLTVNTTSNTDDGNCNVSHCSLIEAVNASNAMVGVQTIKFNIPGTGVHTITLSSSLILTSSAVIDGETQPGYSGSPLIEIVPQSSTTPANAIIINGATPTTYDPNTTVTIRGLVINSFSGFGIHFSNGQGHLIEDNYIGTDATGTVAKGNDTGIMMTASNSIIQNNLISGNLNTGLYLYSNGGRNSVNNAIAGNYIGTNADGDEAIPNQRGIRLTEGAFNNNIGPDNVISGNITEGILIDGNTTSGNIIFNNFIGLSADGGSLLGNEGAGISISGAVNTVIGGPNATTDGNEIWGNLTGITVSNGANNTSIQGNTVAQNGAQGIVVSANNTTISGNTISFQTSRGIVISSGTGNKITANHISDNGSMGIDLAGNGITPNDVGDADTGANNLQNFPVINSALNSSIIGSLNSKPNQTYHLEFFSSEACSVTGYGEGSNGIGSTDVTTDANGNVNFTAQLTSFPLLYTFGGGWTGTFFPSNNLTGTGVPVNNITGGLNFNWGTGVPTINGTPVAGMPSDNFSARFTSSQNFSAGTYTFMVSADDGVRVYIDNVIVLDKFVGRPLTTDQFTVNLTAGSHALKVEYFEGIDQASLQFQWRLNGFVTSTATDANSNTSEFSNCVPIRSVVGTGIYQENDVSLAYSGNWVKSSTTAALGGSYTYTNDSTGKMSFQVDNTVGRITFYRTTYTVYGSTQIYLDGSLFATMNNSSPALVFAVPFTINIPQGSHVIELRNVGSNYSSVDQIDLLASAQVFATGDYQEDNANLNYSGSWVSSTTSSALQGAWRYSSDPTASVSFNVDSSVGRVILYRTTYLSGVYGSLQVFVDGAATPITTLNNTSASIQFGVPFGFYITPGNHTIELRNVGSTYSDIDQITLLPPATPLTTTPGSYQEDAPELLYSGVWLSSSTTGPLGGARKYTNDPNASVSFSIDSSVGRIKLYRTTYAAGVYGSLQVYLDNSATPFITIPNTSAAFLYGQPFTFSVTPGNHVITLKNVGSTYSDIDQINLLPPPAALAVGTYEETEANLVYSGNWLSSVSAGPLGGSRIYTNDPAASMTFNIDSSVGRVTLYRTTYVAGVYGSLQVYLDGSATPFMTIPNTSAAFLYGQPFTFAVIPGSHTITLKNVGSTYSDIDRITLQAAAPLIAGIYQESDANLIYNGTWTANSNASALGGARKYTNDPNATLSFAIDNTVGRVTIYRATYLAGIYGSTQVYLDNNPTPFTTINNVSSTLLFQQPFTFSVTPGNHIITLKNVGSTYSDIDQINLLPPPAALGIGDYQETDSNLTYTGTWTSNANTSSLGGARIYTNDPNASMTFKVDSSVRRVTIYRATYLTGVYGSMQVFLDGSSTPFATISNTSSSLLYQQPFTFFITSGGHTITIKNVGSTYTDLDQISFAALATLSVGDYQETNANLFYNGTWTANSNASALGGARKYSNDPNGTVSFAIDNTVGRVTIYRSTYVAGVYGSTQVFLDGASTPITTIDNTSSTLLFQQPFGFVVTPGNHIITLKNVGSTYSDIDQITLQAPLQVLALGWHEENDANLFYSGTWAQETVQNVTRAYTKDPNGSVSFRIDNTVGRVKIDHSFYASNGGSMQVFLDGAATPLVTINSSDRSSFPIFSDTFSVVPGDHLITIKNVGTTYSAIDKIILSAPVPLGVGTYQAQTTSVIYGGIWGGGGATDHLQYTNESYAFASFSIDNTVGQVSIYRTNYLVGYYDYGSFQILLDGETTPLATVNLATTQSFTFAVIPGNHVITLKKMGTDIYQFVELDHITLAAPVPLTTTSYQESDTKLIYNGIWTTKSNASALGGARRYTNDPNATLSFVIDNTVGQITIYRSTYVAGVYGSTQVFLDNNPTPLTTINNVSSTLLFQQPFTFAVIPGNHVITLKNVGSTYSDIDQITLQAPPAVLTLGSYQETDPNLVYSGTWTSSIQSSALGGSRIYTSDPNSSVTFSIDNSVGRVTIYRTTYAAGVYGSLQVFLDNSPTALTTINNTSSAFLFGQPFTFNVTPGNHSITLKNVGTTYSDLDQITLSITGSQSQLLMPTTTLTETVVTSTPTLTPIVVTATAFVSQTPVETATPTQTITEQPPTDEPNEKIVPSVVPTYTEVQPVTDIPSNTPIPTITSVPTDVPTETPSGG